MRASGKDRALEREKHRKAARLALDTSAHAGSEYHDFMRDNKVPTHLHVQFLLQAGTIMLGMVQLLLGDRWQFWVASWCTSWVIHLLM